MVPRHRDLGVLTSEEGEPGHLASVVIAPQFSPPFIVCLSLPVTHQVLLDGDCL